MDQELLRQLSRISPEEAEILEGRRAVDRSLYMDGSHDVVTGDKLLPPGRQITLRPHTRFIAFPEHTHDYVEMVYASRICWRIWWTRCSGRAPTGRRCCGSP